MKNYDNAYLGLVSVRMNYGTAYLGPGFVRMNYGATYLGPGSWVVCELRKVN